MATLLIVEDDDPIREALAWVFTDLDYHVLQAATGAKALAMLTAAPEPWIVLLDRMLPRISGDQALVMLRQKMRQLPHHQILILTVAGPPTAGIVVSAMHALDAEYCPKTCTLDDLIARVERLADRLPHLPGHDGGGDHFLS